MASATTKPLREFAKTREESKKRAIKRTTKNAGFAQKTLGLTKKIKTAKRAQRIRSTISVGRKFFRNLIWRSRRSFTILV